MEDDEKSTVQSVGDQKEQNDQKKQNFNEETEEVREKVRTNVLTFIKNHFPLIAKIVLIILAIIFIIGIIQILITMPGLILGKLKEFSKGILANVQGWFTGDNISATISKEDEIELAQYIQDMGYDISGFGFADVKYEDNPDDAERDNMITDITDENESHGVRNYLKAYMVQNEAIYTLSTWSANGLFKSLFSSGTAESYSKGMINITINGEQNSNLVNLLRPEINRDAKLLRVKMGNGGLLTQSNYYFNMADWSSRYGKPLELFLSLHLATMMPDLSYDLATAECFNTKVNIDFQDVDVLYGVSYTHEDQTANQEQIEREYLRVRWGINSSYTGEEFEKFYNYVIDYSKKFTYSKNKGIDLTYIDYQMKGEDPKEADEDYEEITETVPVTNAPSSRSGKGTSGNTGENKRPDTSGNTGGNKRPDTNQEGNKGQSSGENKNEGQSGNQGSSSGTTTVTRRVYKPHTFSGAEKPENTWVLSGVLSNLTVNQFKALVDLIQEGKTPQTMFWPRINNVTNHWYYNEIKFTYGRAGTAKKTIQYKPDDNTSPLYGVDGITLDATLTSEEGVYYQLCNPEAVGPNEAIKALFKGGSGELNGISFSFDGKYYRYDGTRQRAQEIANAKAVEANGNESIFENNPNAVGNNPNRRYTFLGQTYGQHKPAVEKEPVVFYDVDGKNTYKNAYSAFAILEKAYTEEAETSYRCLKELLIYLDYFTEDELRDPMSQVLEWLMPDNLDEKNVYKDANKYGIMIRNSLGKSIVAPGNGKVISVNGDTMTIQFSNLDSGILSALQEKYKDELYYIDENSIIDMQMVISGISSNVTAGSSISVGQTLGTANTNEIQVYMKYSDGSIVDDITKYMGQTKGVAKEVDDFGNGDMKQKKGK